jgi:hypothetical protein
MSGAISRIGSREAGSIVRPSLAARRYRAQHAHRVFAVARFRVADHSRSTRFFRVGEAAVEVDHLFGRPDRSRAR